MSQLNMDNPAPWVPASGWERALEIVTLVLVICSWILPIMYYGELPDEVPMHFNAQGEADSWGPKSTLFILPGITSVLYIILTAISRISPGSSYSSTLVPITEENEAIQHRLQSEQVRITKFLTVLLLVHITWGIVRISREGGSHLSNWAVVLYLVAIAATIIIYYRKAKQHA